MIKLTDILKEVEGNKYTIYCDLDGVLVDFDKGYKNLTGKLPKEVSDDAEYQFWISCSNIYWGKNYRASVNITKANLCFFMLKLSAEY